MNNLTDWSDTADVSDAAIEWVLQEADCGIYNSRDVRDYAERGDYEDRAILLAARLIQRHHPELLVDPVDAIVREELAKVYEETGFPGMANEFRAGKADAFEEFTAAKRLYLLGIEKGKQS